jgi:hypothetical protein
MLVPHFVQTRRLARDDKNLFAVLNNRRKIIDERLEPAAESFIVAKLKLIFGNTFIAFSIRWNVPTQGRATRAGSSFNSDHGTYGTGKSVASVPS